MNTTDIAQRSLSFDVIPLILVCSSVLLLSYLFYFIDIISADRLDAVVDSYYGPPLHEMHDTRKWLREAFREEIERYMTHSYSKVEGADYVDYLTDILLTTDKQSTQYEDYWTDEDVLLGYMIQKQERNSLQEEEISDILQIISPQHV